MTHVVQQVIDEIVRTLTGLATTGDSVYPNRIRNFGDDELPALRVFDDDEVIENEDIEGVPYMQQRTIDIIVEAVTRENDTLDATLNRIRLEVEQAIAGNTTLGGLCKQLHCKPMGARKSHDGGSDVQAAQLRMTLRAVVLTMSDAPDVAIVN